MKLPKKILRWLGVVVEVEHAGICAVCERGPSPALGVPIPTTDGTWKHLVCMVVGRQIGEAADQAKVQQPASPAPPRQSMPIILGIVQPAGPEIWN